MNYMNNQMSTMPQQYQPNTWRNPAMSGAYASQMPNVQSAMPQYSYASQPPVNMSVDWIQGGYQSAMAYPKPAPGAGVILMDSDADMFYIKKTDPSGMPLPIRIFKYEEEVQQSQQSQMGRSGAQDMSQFVTKDDFKHMLEEYLGPVNKGDGK